MHVVSIVPRRMGPTPEKHRSDTKAIHQGFAAVSCNVPYSIYRRRMDPGSDLAPLFSLPSSPYSTKHKAPRCVLPFERDLGTSFPCRLPEVANPRVSLAAGSNNPIESSSRLAPRCVYDASRLVSFFFNMGPHFCHFTMPSVCIYRALLPSMALTPLPVNNKT